MAVLNAQPLQLKARATIEAAAMRLRQSRSESTKSLRGGSGGRILRSPDRNRRGSSNNGHATRSFIRRTHGEIEQT